MVPSRPDPEWGSIGGGQTAGWLTRPAPEGGGLILFHRRIPWSVFIILIAFPLQLYFGAGAIGGALHVYEIQSELGAIRADLARLEERRKELIQQQLYLQSDQYVEKVAREELNLIKPGDQALLILPGERPSSAPAASVPVETKNNLAGGLVQAIQGLFDRFLGSGESSSRPSGNP